MHAALGGVAPVLVAAKVLVVAEGVVGASSPADAGHALFAAGARDAVLAVHAVHGFGVEDAVARRAVAGVLGARVLVVADHRRVRARARRAVAGVGRAQVLVGAVDRRSHDAARGRIAGLQAVAGVLVVARQRRTGAGAAGAHVVLRARRGVVAGGALVAGQTHVEALTARAADVRGARVLVVALRVHRALDARGAAHRGGRETAPVLGGVEQTPRHRAHRQAGAVEVPIGDGVGERRHARGVVTLRARDPVEVGVLLAELGLGGLHPLLRLLRRAGHATVVARDALVRAPDRTEDRHCDDRDHLPHLKPSLPPSRAAPCRQRIPPRPVVVPLAAQYMTYDFAKSYSILTPYTMRIGTRPFVLLQEESPQYQNTPLFVKG